MRQMPGSRFISLAALSNSCSIAPKMFPEPVMVGSLPAARHDGRWL
jgi:hypothetical protein